MSRLVTKTMPYTKGAMRAAEAWLESIAVDVLMIDPEDMEAMAESLAEAFHRFATQAPSDGGRAK